MTHTQARRIAILSIVLTPMALLMLDQCLCPERPGLVAPAALLALLPFAFIMANTDNPWRAVAACLGYLPVAALYGLEAQSARLGASVAGWIDLLAPIFALWVLLVSVVGGQLLQALFAHERATKPRVVEHGRKLRRRRHARLGTPAPLVLSR